MTAPRVSVVVPVYNAEAFVAEALTAVLGQSRPPDEVIVVDDGSTDGTQDALAPFRSEIRVIAQTNRGHAGAYNRGFAEAAGDFIARCDADDIWVQDKLERQVAAATAEPRADVLAGAAWCFGATERLFGAAPGVGLLDNEQFAGLLYRANMFCASSTLIRRRLFERLGPFEERLACEDYDFWLRALGAGARFYYDPEVVVRYRQHDANVTNDLVGMYRATCNMHRRHAGIAGDARLVGEVLAYDHARVGRLLVDDDPMVARAEYVAALRHRPAPAELAWALLLSMPDRWRRALLARSGRAQPA